MHRYHYITTYGKVVNCSQYLDSAKAIKTTNIVYILEEVDQVCSARDNASAETWKTLL